MKQIQRSLVAVIGLVATSSPGGTSAAMLKIGGMVPLTGAGARWRNASTQAIGIATDKYSVNVGMKVGGRASQIKVIADHDQPKGAGAVATDDRLRDLDVVRTMLIQTSPSAAPLQPSKQVPATQHWQKRQRTCV